MADMMCPWCGWRYNPAEFIGKPGVKYNPHELVPPHPPTGEPCMGVEQHPRNAESDKRPLWKDGGVA